MMDSLTTNLATNDELLERMSQSAVNEYQTPRGDGETRTNLIINYLPQSMTDKELFNMFVTIGGIDSARIMRDYKTGYSYGFGFINFKKPDDAARAIMTLNGLQIQSKRIKVSYARPPGETIKETNLYVTNLPRDWTDKHIDDLFGQYGMIVQKNFLKDKLTGMPRGVAFVRYDKKEDADAAISNLNGYIPEGYSDAITVKIAEEHGKQKAAFYAGWKAGVQQGRGNGGEFSGRGGNRGGAGGFQPPMSRGGGGPPNWGAQGYGAMRQDRSNNRYNPIGMGGGYNMYNWS